MSAALTVSLKIEMEEDTDAGDEGYDQFTGIT